MELNLLRHKEKEKYKGHDIVTQAITHGNMPNQEDIAGQIGKECLKPFYFMFMLFYDRKREEGTGLSRHSYDPAFRAVYRKRNYELTTKEKNTIILHDIPEEMGRNRVVNSFIYSKIIEDLFPDYSDNVTLLTNYYSIILHNMKNTLKKRLDGKLEDFSQEKIFDEFLRIEGIVSGFEPNIKKDYQGIKKDAISFLKNRFQSFYEKKVDGQDKERFSFINEFIDYFGEREREGFGFDFDELRERSMKWIRELKLLTRDIDIDKVYELKEMIGDYGIFNELILESYKRFYIPSLMQDTNKQLDYILESSDGIKWRNYDSAVVSKLQETEDNVIFMGTVNAKSKYNIKEKALYLMEHTKSLHERIARDSLISKELKESSRLEKILKYFSTNLVKSAERIKRGYSQYEGIDTTYDKYRVYWGDEAPRIKKKVKEIMKMKLQEQEKKKRLIPIPSFGLF